jgi:hypothetical protein
MAGIMDDMPGNDTTDNLRARYEELRRQDDAGNLDDRGRQELSELHERFEGMGQA